MMEMNSPEADNYKARCFNKVTGEKEGGKGLGVGSLVHELCSHYPSLLYFLLHCYYLWITDKTILLEFCRSVVFSCSKN